jgi:predicted CopG family antitoxin
MTAIARLLERKSHLLELLEQNPGPEEREQIERLLAQVNTALDLLEGGLRSFSSLFR